MPGYIWESVSTVPLFLRIEEERDGDGFTACCTVINTGKAAGKETIMVFCEPPQGRLGKPARVLVGFEVLIPAFHRVYRTQGRVLNDRPII